MRDAGRSWVRMSASATRSGVRFERYGLARGTAKPARPQKESIILLATTARSTNSIAALGFP